MRHKNFTRIWRKRWSRTATIRISGYIVEVARSVAGLLSYKATIPHDLRTAYDKKDKNTLAALAQKDIPSLIEAADKLLKAVEAQWRRESRAFGLEVQQLRIGGMKQRLTAL